MIVGRNLQQIVTENHEHNNTDPINPPYYKIGGIETIDYMKAKSTPEELRGHLRLTALKYLSRVGHKDEVLKEYKKAKWYLDKLISEIEGDEYNHD
jgi:hypothetical protein